MGGWGWSEDKAKRVQLSWGLTEVGNNLGTWKNSDCKYPIAAN